MQIKFPFLRSGEQIIIVSLKTAETAKKSCDFTSSHVTE